MTEQFPPDRLARDRILNDLDTSLLVEAGAGSGKTTAMVGRMVALIRSGRATTAQIVAVTFTRKAAAELRERFQDELERAGRDASLDAGGRARVRRALDELDLCFVGTIHSFCARLLRERPLDAGVPPDFRETSGPDEEALRRETFSRFVERLSTRSGLPRTRASRLLAPLIQVGLAPRQLQDLFNTIAANEDVAFPAARIERPNADEVAKARTLLEELLDRSRELMPRFEPHAGYDDLQRKVNRLHFARRRWTDEVEFYNALTDAVYGSNWIAQYRWSDSSAGKQAARELQRRWESLNEPGHPLRTLLSQWFAHRYPLALRFARAAAAYYRRERRRTGRLTFQDLLLFTAAMLRRSPAARADLAARYRYVLVDEFQDTDPVQAEILFRLTADPTLSLSEFLKVGAMPANSERIDSESVSESESVGTAGGTPWQALRPRAGALFVVGDPKQSIYRFRRADIALYAQVKQRFLEFGDVVTLTANFRSNGHIGRFVNAVFRARFPEEEPVEGRQAAYAPLLTDPAKDDDGLVWWYELEPVDGRQQGWRISRPDSARLASLIRERIDSGFYKPGDFLVLTRTRAQLRAYARALEEHNVPFQVSGAGVGVEDELRELILLLRALEDPDDPVLTVAVLEGLFFGLDHATLFEHARTGSGFNFVSWQRSGTPVDQALDVLHEFWVRACRESADVLIPTIVDELGILPWAAAGELGATRAGALLYALDVLRHGALHGRTSLPEAIELLEDALKHEADAETPLVPGAPDVVRLMNLHKAKGLEAPVVILAYPAAADERPKDGLIMRRRPDGSAHGFLAVNDAIARERRPIARPLDWDDLLEREQKYLLAEEDRLMYVAATRAAEELIVARCRSAPHSVWNIFHPFLDNPELAHPAPLLESDPPDRASLEIAASDLIHEIDRVAATRARLATPTYRATAVTAFAKLEQGGPRMRRKLRSMQLSLGLDAPAGAESFGHDRFGRPIVQLGLLEAGTRSERPRNGNSSDDTFAFDAETESRGPEWGNAVHATIQAAMRGARGEELVRAARDALIAADCPLDEHGDPIWLDELGALAGAIIASALWNRAQDAKRFLVEAPFAVTLSPGQWRELTNLPDAGVPELVEGRVDLAFEEDDGWTIVDYKSDATPTRARRQQYQRQLDLYAACWQMLTGRPVKERLLVYTATGEEDAW